MDDNKQPREKQDLRTGGQVAVHSIWDTIQGEGPYAGHPATFVRLAGCNLQCRLCDTDYTSSREWMMPEAVWARLFDSVGRLVVLTGGEPFRQNIGPLVRYLTGKHREVQIETNGTLFIQDFPYHLATVVCSPKTPQIDERLLPHIDAFKYVVAAGQIDPEDGLPLSSLGENGKPYRQPEDECLPVYVQPLDEQHSGLNKKHMEAAVQSCLEFGHILCLQTHKIAGVE